MEDRAKIEMRHWTSFDQAYMKDFFRDSPHMKLSEIMAERDAHLAERDKAIAEKKNAYAERNTALLQRDLAYAERNAAWMERDSAIKALHMMRANESDHESTAKIMQMMQFIVNNPSSVGSGYPNEAAAAADNNDMIAFPLHTEKARSPTKEQPAKSGSADAPKRPRMANGEKKASKPSGKKRKQRSEDEDGMVSMDRFEHEEDSPKGIGASSPYDVSSIPVPLCSCTGTSQRCYKWGNGGWQSACCTKFVSVYPLPMSEIKSGCRVPGRKMSGSAFTKLLEKLTALGVDITKPIDLKDHWAKHGTNRYVTIK